MPDSVATESASPPRPRARGDAISLRDRLAIELGADRWKTGERMPTERALSERYGVARNTVRRALQALEDEALIVRHVGRGTFRTGTATAAQPTAVDDFAGCSPAAVIECRLVFEPQLAPLIVGRASQQDLDRMEECLLGGEAAATTAEFEVWDGALHDAFAVATRNEAMIAVTRSLARVRLQAEWGQIKARSMTPERRARLQSEHRGIVEAFRQRDREEAARLLREHILFVRSYMLGA
jgi:DNA-binding FadR family transcriptional regulator